MNQGVKVLIGHASDLHGKLTPILTNTREPHLWVLTGDLWPNKTRGDASIEIPFQTEFIEKNVADLRKAFGGKPVLVIDGNHCYAPTVELFKKHGIDARQVELERKTVEFRTKDILTGDGGSRAALTYAGFREIPYIAGEWMGEVSDQAVMTSLVDKVVGESPNLLITHCPANGIMDNRYGASREGVFGYGIPQLTSQLFYRPHSIKAHLFGHIHQVPGEEVHTAEDGHKIVFSNAACTLRFVEVEL